jgi:hypothetical protein
MNDASPIPWAGLMVAGITVVVVFGLVALLNLLATLAVTARDELRDRYCGGGWRPRLIDLLGVPTWVGLELTCLLGGLLFLLLAAWLVYSAARDFRDWWHRGDRGR